jgi:hypothetical protein
MTGIFERVIRRRGRWGEATAVTGGLTG